MQSFERAGGGDCGLRSREESPSNKEVGAVREEGELLAWGLGKGAVRWGGG
jgi:hypothetical protein